MSAQLAEREKRSLAPVQRVLAITRTVPGFGGTRLLTAFSGDTYAAPLYLSAGIGYTLSTNAASGVSVSGTFYTGIIDYDPDFVASILAADASEPEASFDNVVDLLDWLNRE
jgi:hypothetical protein